MIKTSITKKVSEIVFLLLVAVVTFMATIQIYRINAKEDYDVVEDVRVIENRYVVQGDVTIFKIYNEKILSLKDETTVEIINSKGTVVGTACISGDEILIDTSLLLTGGYRLKLSNAQCEVIAEDSFVVSLITVR